MGVALMIVVAVLLVFVVVVSLHGRRGRRAAREQEQAAASVRAGKAEAQHKRSLRRRADVRAAHAEHASEVGPDTDE
jgi:hypothetical protein